MTPSTREQSVADLLNRTDALVRAGQYREALDLAEQAGGEIDETVDSGLAARMLLLLARLRRELARHDDAEEAALRAQALLSARKDHPDYARGLAELARVYEAQGKYEQATQLGRRALGLREATLGPDAPETADSLHDLALVNDALGNRVEAERLARRCLDIRRRVLGDDHPETAQAWLIVAWVVSGLGKLQEAERAARSAVAICRRVLPPGHPDLASALHRAGAVALSRCHLAEAEPLLEEALRLRQAALGRSHPYCAGTMEYLAILRGYQGRPADSEKLARQALEITRSVLGDEHPYAIDSLSNLAQALSQLRRFDEAERLARQALDLVRQVMGEKHPAVVRHTAELAGHLVARNSRESAAEAEELLRSVLPLCERAGSGENPPDADAAHLYYQLARCLIAQEHLPEAREAAEKCLEIYRLAYEGEHPALANGLQLLAGLEQALGQTAAAETRHRDAVALLVREMGETHLWTLEAQRLLAGHLRQRNTPQAWAEAEQILRNAVGRLPAATPRERTLPADREARDPARIEDRFSLEEDLASTLQLRGQHEEAEMIYQRLVRERQRALGEDHLDVSHTHEQLAFLYEEMGNLQAAESRHQQALGLRQHNPGQESPEYGASLMGLAGLYHRHGRPADAEPLYQQARELFRTNPGENSTNFAFCTYQLGLLYRDLGDLARAEPLLEQARDAYQGVYGNRQLETLRVVRSLAQLYRNRGEFGRSVRLLRQMLEDLEEAAPDNLLERAATLLDLALVHYSCGDYLAAEPLFEEARSLHVQVGGEDSPLHVGTLQQQVVLYRALGEFDRAEQAIRQAIEILSRLAGEDHLDTAAARQQLADLLVARAAAGSDDADAHLARATDLHQQVLDTRRQAFGRNHPLVAESLTRLSGAHLARGQIDQAEALQRQAIATYESMGWNNHPDYAVALRLLAAILRNRGRTDEAETWLRRCLAILSRPEGEFHPILLPSLMQLGELYRGSRKYNESDDTFHQALDIVREGLPDNDTARALLLRELGLTQRFAGRHPSAEQYLRQALEIERSQRGDERPEPFIVRRHLAAISAATGRHADALATLQQVTTGEERFLPLAMSLTDVREREGWARDLVEGMNQFLDLLRRYFPGRSDLARVAYDIVLRRKGARTEALSRPREQVLAGRHPTLAGRLRRWAHLSRQIAGRTLNGPSGNETPEEHNRLLTGWRQEHEQLTAELSESIPDLTAYQERWNADHVHVAAALPTGGLLIDFVRLTTSSYDNPAGETDTPTHYLAFVLPANRPEQLRLLDLGPVEPIDHLARSWFHALTRAPADRPEGNGAEVDRLARSLAEAILRPMGDAIEQAGPLFFGPAGELIRVPLAALPDRQGQPLLNKHVVHYLASGQELLNRFGRRRAEGPAVVVSYGRPAATAAAPASVSWWRRLLGSGRPGSEPPLAAEGQRLATVLGGSSWTGPEARTHVLEASAPRFLHLASACYSPSDPAPGPGLTWLNPLTRPVVSLTGYDDTHLSEGVISAEALTGIDLAGSGVFLSLTEKGPETTGPIAFARAARLAGAAWAVTALWQPPEEARRAFIEAFYQRVLAGQPPAEAAREAQRAVAARHPDAHAWAGWVVWG
jgi:tetratricopeptide (TPR) repeat protein